MKSKLISLLQLRENKKLRRIISFLIPALILIAGICFIRIQKPEEYYSAELASSDATVSTCISIRCDSVAGMADSAPADGCIIDKLTLSCPEGSTALDQLILAAKQEGLLIDNSGGYITSINNLREGDFGDMSGWTFEVNGEIAQVSCGNLVLNPGDSVEWLYIRDFNLYFS